MVNFLFLYTLASSITLAYRRRQEVTMSGIPSWGLVVFLLGNNINNNNVAITIALALSVLFCSLTMISKLR